MVEPKKRKIHPHGKDLECPLKNYGLRRALKGRWSTH
jgi:hypothetical protein